MPIQRNFVELINKPLQVWSQQDLLRWLSSLPLPPYCKNTLHSVLSNPSLASNFLQQLQTLPSSKLSETLHFLLVHEDGQNDTCTSSNNPKNVEIIVKNVLSLRKRFYNASSSERCAASSSYELHKELEKIFAQNFHIKEFETCLSRVVDLHEEIWRFEQKNINHLKFSMKNDLALEYCANFERNHSSLITKKTAQGLLGMVSEKPSILVVGDTNAGKSTVINSLLGKEIMVAEDYPCTCTYVSLKYGNQNVVKVYYSDGIGECEYLPFDDDLSNFPRHLFDKTKTKSSMMFSEPDHYHNVSSTSQSIQDSVINTSSNNERSMTRIEIQCNIDILKYITLVDTPGFNDEKQISEQILELSDHVDVVMFVVNATTSLGQNNKEMISRLLNRRCHEEKSKKLFFVYNKMDMVVNKEKKKDALFDELSQHISDVRSNYIHFISAKQALESTTKEFIPVPNEFVETQKSFEDFVKNLIIERILRCKSTISQSIRESIAMSMEFLKKNPPPPQTGSNTFCSFEAETFKNRIGEFIEVVEGVVQVWREQTNKSASYLQDTIYKDICHFLENEESYSISSLEKALSEFIEKRIQKIMTDEYLKCLHKILEYKELQILITSCERQLENSREDELHEHFHGLSPAQMGILGSFALVGTTTGVGLGAVSVASVAGAVVGVTSAASLTGGLVLVLGIPATIAGVGALAIVSYIKNEREILDLKSVGTIRKISTRLSEQFSAGAEKMQKHLENRIREIKNNYLEIYKQFRTAEQIHSFYLPMQKKLLSLEQQFGTVIEIEDDQALFTTAGMTIHPRNLSPSQPMKHGSNIQ